MTSNTNCYSCKKYGEYCEYANMYGNCLSTACKKVTTVTSEFSPVLPDYRIVHRKDGVYDLLDSTSWIMSRGCIDDILNFLSTTSKESMEDAGYEESDIQEQREYEDYMDCYTDILAGMLQERGVDPWKDYIEEEKTEG